MSSANLLKPVLDSGIRSVNFFNGRLLTAEDLSREQDANRETSRLLGQAIGEGIAYGLEVSKAAGSGTEALVTIQPGTAINRNGAIVRLPVAVNLSLVRPQDGAANGQDTAFIECQPFQAGVYVTGSGVYLLTARPARGSEGRAPVSGLQNSSADCNTKYRVDGVQFQLLQLDFTAGELSDQNHLRSIAAFKCFGVSDLVTLQSTPFGSQPLTHGILDQLRPNRLTDCDVPLAILDWTASAGIRFVDSWSVRRRLMNPEAGDRWRIVAGDRRRSEAEAMLLQFQDQLDAVRETASLGGTPPASQIAADQHFKFLPPAGYLPAGPNGFDWKKFLGPHAPDHKTLIDEGLLRSVIHGSLFRDAITISPFNVAAQPGISPPAPVTVYQVAGQSSFVVFARSWNGRVRVFLNQTPASNETVDINATSKTGNAQFNAAVVTGPMRPIVDVPPGPYRVNVSVQGYQTVNPVGVNVIGGETIDLSVALQKLPQGRIVLTVVDSTGTSIANRVAGVTAVSVPAGMTRTGVLVAGKWTIEDLPAGSYNVTVAAPGYRPATLSGIQIALGEVEQRTVTMVRETGDRPPLCVEVKGVKRPVLQKARLCLVLSCFKGTTGGFTTTGSTSRFVKKRVGKGDDITRADFELENQFEFEVRGPEEVPWSDMVQLEPLTPDVLKWLAAWQQWFNKQYPGQGIGSARPAIFINPRYIPPRGLRDVPDSPQAYAVFGKFGRPMTVNVSTSTTNRAVRTKQAKIRGVADDELEQLERCGIKYIDQVSGLWAAFLSNELGQSADTSRFMILDSITAVDDINKTRRYYEGWDAEVQAIFTEMGLTDDVAVANADREELGRRLKSAGFADRLIKQSREIVPRDGWSLETLGFTKSQSVALEAQGIASKGEFIKATEDPAGSTTVGGLIGVVGTNLNLIRAEAISQLAASSIALAPMNELGMLPGVNANVAERLADADITSTEALAGADRSTLATKTGLTEEAAAGLIESAARASHSRIDIAALAAISSSSAEALKANFDTRTIADLASKEPEAIAAAFGGDINKARAVIQGVKAGLVKIRR